jgi:hypothetical protein
MLRRSCSPSGDQFEQLSLTADRDAAFAADARARVARAAGPDVAAGPDAVAAYYQELAAWPEWREWSTEPPAAPVDDDCWWRR